MKHPVLLKIGFAIVVLPTDPVTVEVTDEEGIVVYRAEIAPFERRVLSRRWLTRRSIVLHPESKLAKTVAEADELIERKLTELWGNPFVNRIPEIEEE